MKVRVAFIALVATLAVFTAFQRTHSQTNKSSGGSALTDSERELLNEINEARANPHLYATYLEKLKPQFSGKQYTPAGKDPLTTEEGWHAVDEAIRFLKALKPLPPLIASSGLSLAALTHVKDQGGSGGTGHRSANNNLIEERVKPYGRWSGAIGENICYGNDSARERLLTWLIDDGFPSRGHRRRLLGTEFQVAGISCGSHPQYNAMCVLTLAGGFSEFNPGTSPAKATKTPAKTTTTPAKTTATATKTTSAPAKTTPPKSGGTKSKPAKM
ncbi:MAG TPA: CAP domain-containing protein [Pyrinomonadaceae bacterium]|nr:CAP domain-containing protein [Pyrinomonadaceae bacterium]